MSNVEVQKNVIEEYLYLRGNPSLRSISSETGIQITRVYRILKGHEMKLSEYKTFLDCIKREEGVYNKNSDFLQTAKSCFFSLPLDSLNEITLLMERKLLGQDLVSNI